MFETKVKSSKHSASQPSPKLVEIYLTGAMKNLGAGKMIKLFVKVSGLNRICGNH